MSPTAETKRALMIVSVVVVLAASALADALGLPSLPRWIPVILMPTAIGALAWHFNGAKLSAIVSWLAPLVLVLILGYFAVPYPIGEAIIALAYAWVVAMILSERFVGAWYRYVLRQ